MRLWLIDSQFGKGKIMAMLFTVLNVLIALLLYACIAEPVMEVGEYIYRDKFYPLIGLFIVYPIYFVFFAVSNKLKQ